MELKNLLQEHIEENLRRRPIGLTGQVVSFDKNTNMIEVSGYSPISGAKLAFTHLSVPVIPGVVTPDPTPGMDVDLIFPGGQLEQARIIAIHNRIDKKALLASSPKNPAVSPERALLKKTEVHEENFLEHLFHLNK